MQMTPLIAVHMTAALAALAIGPVALWARKGRLQRPRLHKAFGYAWVTLMLVTALTAIFIRDFRLPNTAGYTPIHVLVPVTLAALFGAFWFLARGNIRGHRLMMQWLYVGGCLVAGAFTLLPNRYLGGLLWGSGVGRTVQQILAQTPLWVWPLLGALVTLGLVHARRRTVGVSRTAVLPLAMGGLSFWSTVSVFGTSPAVLASWCAAAALIAMLVLPQKLPAGTHYDPVARQFDVPGSWLPLVLFMAIFITRYAVNVSLAMNPLLRTDPGFALAVASLYGVFTGLFAGRALRLLRLARRPAASAPLPVNA